MSCKKTSMRPELFHTSEHFVGACDGSEKVGGVVGTVETGLWVGESVGATVHPEHVNLQLDLNL